jgi:hypothetical protein
LHRFLNPLIQGFGTQNDAEAQTESKFHEG